MPHFQVYACHRPLESKEKYLCVSNKIAWFMKVTQDIVNQKWSKSTVFLNWNINIYRV